MDVRFYGQSDVGRRREVNEDAYTISEENGLMILADGMGGHESGEVASRMAVEGMLELVQTCRPTHVPVEHPAERERFRAMITCLFNEWVLRTNSRIHAEGVRRQLPRRMGTTLCCLYSYEDMVVLCHVGDSRIYRLRRDVLEQVTTDHSVANERLRAQEVTRAEARTLGHHHVITRALGTQSVVRPEIQVQDLCPGDVYLLCSDGLHDLVQDREIREVLMAFRDRLDRAAGVLVDIANRRGGHDNITVVIGEMAERGVLGGVRPGVHLEDTEALDETTECMEDLRAFGAA
ncbi:MAG: serine/threonine-protein phosphatase [Planctomycetes bacterium]|nr:serine/threonine-protein phosphatase [Planctomycetota bacterium]